MDSAEKVASKMETLTKVGGDSNRAWHGWGSLARQGSRVGHNAAAASADAAVALTGQVTGTLAVTEAVWSSVENGCRAVD
jgi:hypothetical protein